MESEFLLHSDMFYKIMVSGLETSDVVRCMQVCKLWKICLAVSALLFLTESTHGLIMHGEIAL